MATVYDRTNSEKLVYLEHAEENGSVKNAGLSHTGDQYMEAINCLNGRYSRPRTHPTGPCSCYVGRTSREGGYWKGDQSLT